MIITYNMSYAKLNKIYPEFVKIQCEEYSSVIGGVGRPWNKLNEVDENTDPKMAKKHINDSECFANFHREDPHHTNSDDSPWKIHLSIHPEDLGKAWDLIYPVLIKHQVPNFKVSRLAVTEVMVRKLRELPPSFLEAKGLDKSGMIQAIEDMLRVYHGMQITIYIEEDAEQQYNKILEEIEPLLYEAGIRPGIIDKSDRALGMYSSIRHIGKTYTTHDKVTGYKSTLTKDPFNPIKLNYKKINIQWSTLDLQRQIMKAKLTLQQVLDGKRKYDNAIIDRREFLQICDVAKEYFTRWHQALHAKSTVTESKEYLSFKKWIEDGCHLIDAVRGNKTRRIIEMEDVITSTSRIQPLSDLPRPLLKRAVGQRKLDFFREIPTTIPLPKKEVDMEDILNKLEKHQLQVSNQELKRYTSGVFELESQISETVFEQQQTEVPAIPNIYNSSSFSGSIIGAFAGLFVLSPLLLPLVPQTLIVLFLAVLSCVIAGSLLGYVIDNNFTSQDSKEIASNRLNEVSLSEEVPEATPLLEPVNHSALFSKDARTVSDEVAEITGYVPRTSRGT